MTRSILAALLLCVVGCASTPRHPAVSGDSEDADVRWCSIEHIRPSGEAYTLHGFCANEKQSLFVCTLTKRSS